MLTLVVHEKGGKTRRVGFGGDHFTVGRDDQNHLVLDRTNVSKQHLRLARRDGTIELVDLGSTNGTYLNGRKLRAPAAVRRSDRIYVGDYILMLEGDDPAIRPRQVAEIDVRGPDGALLRTSITLPTSANETGQALPGVDPVAGDPVLTSARQVAAAGTESRALDGVVRQVLETVLVNLGNLDPFVAAKPSKEDRREASSLVDSLLAEHVGGGRIDEAADTEGLRRRVLAELLDLGPLDAIMAREDVREIHVVGNGRIRVVRASEHDGVTVGLSDHSFSCNRAVTLVMHRLARRRGFLVEGANVVEGRVDNGFYLYGLVPPSQVRVPVMSLRRTRTDARNLDALVQEGVLSPQMATLLSAAARGCRRIVICASGGVNLDRFVGALLGEVPDELRVVCVSDAGRLGIDRPGWIQVRRLAQPGDAIGLADTLGVLFRGGVDLLASQRCRAEDAASVLDALSGAATGVVVSTWGVDAEHALTRLAAMGARAGCSVPALTSALARSVDLVVRLGVGVNRERLQVLEVSEPRVRDDDNPTQVSLFHASLASDGTTRFSATGNVPQFVSQLADLGEAIPNAVFQER
ncbi:MAG: FHA domain-containing protein [Myxococcales bacterium FL481]|nr:MAG: FHA domain-containing protein [Myxococcales bacterium FL481]TPV95123.1 MAG: FHA domain-containing protein [Myxococcales bacterium FL481]